MITLKTQVVGTSSVMRELAELGRGARNKILRPALNKAAQPQVKSAKSHCPNVTQNRKPTRLLRKSLGLRTKTYKTAVVVTLGPRRGFRTQIGTTRSGKPIIEDPVKIAHLVEEGHGGPAPAPAHRFMRPAWDQAGGLTALGVVEAEVARRLMNP